MAKTFPDYHPLHIYNDYIYTVSDSSKHHVYIFRFTKEKGAIVGVNETTEYFKGVVKPIIFTDDYNWDENSKLGSYSFDSMDKVLSYLSTLSGIKGEK